MCQEGGLRRGVLGGRLGFLIGDLEDRVILGNMDDLGRPQGSNPESFVSLSLFLAEIQGFVYMLKKRSTQQTDNRHTREI